MDLQSPQGHGFTYNPNIDHSWIANTAISVWHELDTFGGVDVGVK